MSEEGLICSIDLQFTSDFEGEDWFVITVCGHSFHNSCLEEWFTRGHSKCPMCNAEIRSAGLRRMHGITPTKRQYSQSSGDLTSEDFVEIGTDCRDATPTLEELAISSQTPDFNFKIVLLGTAGVGKSCLIQRYANGVFQFNLTSTIGTDVAFKTLSVGGKIIKLTIWDTSGQERFKSVSRNFARNAHGALLVYSYDIEESAKEIPYWLDFLKTCSCSYSEPAVLLVGNKVDMEEKEITTDTGRDIAIQNRLDLFETSAKDDLNVDSVFRALAVEILQKIENNQLQYTRQDQGQVLTENQELGQAEKKRRCC